MSEPKQHPELRAEARDAYASRREQRSSTLGQLESRHVLLSNIRVGLFLGFLIQLWLAFGPDIIPRVSLLVIPGLFVALILVHESLLRKRDRAARAVAFYELGIARLDDQWMGKGRTGSGYADPAHLYEADLDLFGRGSLFERISQARTGAGESTLAGWLLHPSTPAEIRARQETVNELRSKLDLRERLGLLGTEFEVGGHPRLLLHWSRQPIGLRTWWVLAAASTLAAIGVAGTLAWANGMGIAFLAGAIALQVLFRAPFQKSLNRIRAEVDEAAADLKLLSGVLEIFEKESFSTPYLREMQTRLRPEGRLPSSWIRRLAIYVDCLEGQRNALFAPIAFLLLWDVHFSFAIEQWRKHAGIRVPDWLDSVGQLEALCSLAGYAFECPEDPFPEITEDGTVFDGEEIGHPLLPSNSCVRNQLHLDSARQLLVVSGSNMSGKSTLLRTVGLLSVLAFAGAPVRAKRLRLSPLRIGASLRVQDSIQSGVSRFYAEIQRLRAIVAITEDAGPSKGDGSQLLFLVDEILQGTNSHDRRIGVAAVMRTLVERGAIGMITTHDLALTAIAEELAPKSENVHFEDHLEDGEMVFDYRLQKGVVTRSNALGLMRAVGLSV